MHTKTKNMRKKLTPTMRAAYEGHKNAICELPQATSLLEGTIKADLEYQRIYKVATPQEYVKLITIEEQTTLGKFLEKIITLGSTHGFVSFMMLYQYMYDKKLLGHELEELTGQEVINHLYGDQKYKLKLANKQRFLLNIIKLSGLQLCIESWEETHKIRQQPGRETERAFKHFSLLKVASHTTKADGHTITSLRGVSIMKDFINLWYNKLSRLFIPLEDVLSIPHDYNGDHRRGFNLSLALRHAELGSKKNYVQWDLQQCLNVGQWSVPLKRKTKAWTCVIESLNAGKRQQLIDYYFIYKPNKPQELRHIEKVVITRLWHTQAESMNIDFNPEKISPELPQIKTKQPQFYG